MCVGPLDSDPSTVEKYQSLDGVEGSEEFKEWVIDRGGLQAFDGDIKKAREEYAAVVGGSGEALGTDAAETPGKPAPSPDFVGPRIETDRTGMEDLKNVDTSPSSLPTI